MFRYDMLLLRCRYYAMMPLEAPRPLQRRWRCQRRYYAQAAMLYFFTLSLMPLAAARYAAITDDA